MTPPNRLAPLTVRPCPKCGCRAFVAFDLMSHEMWGRIYCSSCDHTTKTTTYREAKSEWNDERPRRRDS